MEIPSLKCVVEKLSFQAKTNPLFLRLRLTNFYCSGWHGNCLFYFNPVIEISAHYTEYQQHMATLTSAAKVDMMNKSAMTQIWI